MTLIKMHGQSLSISDATLACMIIERRSHIVCITLHSLEYRLPAKGICCQSTSDSMCVPPPTPLHVCMLLDLHCDVDQEL
jgi:hypothetical protein